MMSAACPPGKRPGPPQSASTSASVASESFVGHRLREQLSPRLPSAQEIAGLAFDRTPIFKAHGTSMPRSRMGVAHRRSERSCQPPQKAVVVVGNDHFASRLKPIIRARGIGD
jgi:hypothetical protein